MAYVAATTASVSTALLFNKIVASSPSLSAGIVGRLVPLMAVAAANCVNIPCMRQQEIMNGISVETGTKKKDKIARLSAFLVAGAISVFRVLYIFLCRGLRFVLLLALLVVLGAVRALLLLFSSVVCACFVFCVWLCFCLCCTSFPSLFIRLPCHTALATAFV